MPLDSKALVVHPQDNVAVALEDIPLGASVKVLGPGKRCLPASEEIPFAHKIALQSIEEGQPILKYGVPIGFATCRISAGAWVHEHNVKSYFVARREGQIQ